MGEYITANQRKLAHAFARDIAKHLESDTVSVMEDIKNKYKEVMDDEGFTLKSEESKAERKCTTVEFKDFMDYMLYIAHFIGYHSNTSPMVYFEDTERYLAVCIKFRLCSYLK